MTTTPFTPDILTPKAKTLFDEALDDQVTHDLLSMVQKKHEPTLQHSLGVGRILSSIATATDIRDIIENPIAYVREGVLHDIGKVSIDKVILDWQGRLSEPAMSMMRLHSIDGFQTVRSIYRKNGLRKPENNFGVHILLSHFTQRDQYPSKDEVAKLLADNNIVPQLLDNPIFMLGSIGLSIADHFEARFPSPKKDGNAHGYSRRNYKASILPGVIKSSFLESETVNDLGLIYEGDMLDERMYEVITHCGELAVKAEQLRNSQ